MKKKFNKLGFTIANLGGGCRAFEKPMDYGSYILISHENDLPERA